MNRKRVRFDGPLTTICQQLPNLIPRELSGRHRASLQEWVDGNTAAFEETHRNLDREQFATFILKYLWSNPFFPKQMVFYPPAGGNVELPKRLTAKFRGDLFNLLENTGKKSSFSRSWLWAIKKVLVSSVNTVFGKQSFCTTKVFQQLVNDEHYNLRLESGNSNIEILDIACSKYAMRYVTTLLFPPVPGNTVELEIKDQRYVQFRDTNKAEQDIARICHKLQKQPNAPQLNISDNIMEQLEGKQEDAIRYVAKRRLTIICGKAGTGKSHTVKVLAKWLDELNEIYFCISPYHKTVDRLREFGIKNASTAASWLMQPRAGKDGGEQTSGGRVNVDDQKDFNSCSKFSPLSPEGQTCQNHSSDDPDPSKWCPTCTTVLVMDETGISGTHAMAGMFKWVNEDPSRRIVLVGDNNQLPPICGGSSISAIVHVMQNYAVKNGDTVEDGCVVELEKIRRVAKGKEALIEIAHNILHNDPTIPESDAIECLEHREHVWKHFEVGTSVVVTNSNKEAKEMNLLLSKQHFKSIKNASYCYPKNTFFYGEVVCATKGAFNGTMGILACTKKQDVVKTTMVKGKYTKTTKPVQFAEVEVFGITKKTVDIPIEELIKGYAVTVNKAQGSEFKQVFVMVNGEGLRMFRNKRWMYTSVTRAKEKLFFITDMMTEYDYYAQVLKNTCHSLVGTTLIDTYFRTPEIVKQVKHQEWSPEVKISESHDARITRDLLKPKKAKKAKIQIPNFDSRHQEETKTQKTPDSVSNISSGAQVFMDFLKEQSQVANTPKVQEDLAPNGRASDYDVFKCFLRSNVD